MELYDLDERGYFWWSDEPIQQGQFAPSNGSYGRLTVSDVGAIHLELDSRLSTDQNPFKALENSGRKLARQISGILRNTDHFVLLRDVWRDGGRVSTNGLSYERYMAEVCLVSGSPFVNPTQPPRYRRLTIPLAGFEEWLKLGAIEGRRTKSVLRIKHRIPNGCKYPLDDGVLAIDFDLVGPYFGRILDKEVNLREESSFVYRFKRAVVTEVVIEKYRWLGDLLILLTNVERTLDWPTVRVGPKSARATLYFRRVKRVTKEVTWHDCWTSFPALKESFGDILANWNAKRDLIGPGLYLYLGTRRGMDLYAEHKFVSLAFGLESFHRTFNPTFQDVKLSAKINRIVSQIASQKDRKWLESRLKNLAGPNLQQRIVEMLRPLPIGLDEKRLQDFAERCAKFRNDISHHGRVQGAGIYLRHLRALSYVNEALGHLYHARILLEVGVPNEVIQRVFNDIPHAFPIRYALSKVNLVDQEPGFKHAPEDDDD